VSVFLSAPESPFDRHIPDLVLRTGIPGRYAARNALRHLQKAAAIAGTDMEMAAFRAITAEEEAATALIHALKRNGYRGAERLNVRKHEHKAACMPLLDAVNNVLAKVQAAGTLVVELKLNPSDQKTPLTVQVWFPALPIGKRVVPIPPLDFTMFQNDAFAPFHEELRRFAEESGAGEVLDYLRERANKRNQLLYASQDGIPQVTSRALAGDGGAVVPRRTLG
jgi:hypothetical protein